MTSSPVASTEPVARGTESSRARRLAVLGIVLVATSYRLPALVNAGAVDSDAAVVGLQASHILRGEWAWRLWGTDYQGSLDALLAAISFFVLGASPVALIAVPFVGLLVMVTLSFDLLRRHVGAFSAAMLVAPLVFAPMASNLPMFVVMRQSLATTVVASVWLADGIARSRRPGLRVAASALALGLGLYIDLFAVVVVPAAGLFLLSSAGPALPWLRRVSPRFARRWLAVVGLLAGAAAIAVVVAIASGRVPPRVASNAALLVRTCLPFALGTKIFVKGEALDMSTWSAPLPVACLQTAGAAIFVLSILSAAPGALSRSVPIPVRRLGALGLLTTVATLAAFVLSTKPVDMWSSRYLAPIFWMAPFTLAPLAHRLGSRRLALLQSPWWVTALLGGWLSYGLYVDGPLPRRHPRAVGEEERALRSHLLESGVHHAEANYWLSYRLTFLFDEDPIVVPFDRKQERYAPYRRSVDAAKVYAMIFHPSIPLARPEAYEALLRGSGTPYERREVGGFTVLVVRR